MNDLSLLQPEPIYNLIPPTIAHSQEKRSNVLLAIDEYVAEYSVCKCKPCMNGGTVVQMDGNCVCLCLPQYEGLVCEKLRSAQHRGENYTCLFTILIWKTKQLRHNHKALKFCF